MICGYVISLCSLTFSATKGVKREFLYNKESQTARIDTATLGRITLFSADYVDIP
jgi:hypothetical protein